MRTLSSLLLERRSIENPAVPLTASNILGVSAQASSAGPVVTEQTALAFSAVFGAVRILGESMAVMPIELMERQDDGGTEKARTSALYRLLKHAPNSYQTPAVFQETMQTHVTLWGNAVAQIIRGGDSVAKELRPLHPSKTEIKQKPNGEKEYTTTDEVATKQVLSDRDVLHIPGLGDDGVKGYTPIRVATRSIGIALAAQEFAARFFKNGAWLGGVLEHPGPLSDSAFERLRADLASKHTGAQNAFAPLILEEGMKWAGVTMPAEDALLLALQQFQVKEVARIYRIPPYMLAEGDPSFSNITTQAAEFVKYSLNIWLTKWEQELARKLLLDKARETFAFKFNTNVLLRGDTMERFRAYAVGGKGGFLSINDIRMREDMPRVEGGDEYLVPLNMRPADQPAPEPSDGTPDTHNPPDAELGKGSKDDERSLSMFTPLIADVAQRLVTREVDRVRKAHAKQDGETFAAWLPRFYDEHAAIMRDALQPLGDALAIYLDSEHVRAVLAVFCNDYCRGACDTVLDMPRLEEYLARKETDYAPEMVSAVLERVAV